jgi:hypothetical protein
MRLPAVVTAIAALGTAALAPALRLHAQPASARPAARPSDRDLLIADWERDRDNLLAYVAAIPENRVEFQPTPGVRTFAQQIEHLAGTNVEVAAVALNGLKEAPSMGDSARYLHDRAALVTYARNAYEYVIAAVRAATPAQLARQTAMYGQPPATAARWLQLSREHTAWTLGQTVPYLRLNGVTPPSYKMPF